MQDIIGNMHMGIILWIIPICIIPRIILIGVNISPQAAFGSSALLTACVCSGGSAAVDRGGLAAPSGSPTLAAGGLRPPNFAPQTHETL